MALLRYAFLLTSIMGLFILIQNVLDPLLIQGASSMKVLVSSGTIWSILPNDPPPFLSRF